MTTSPDRVLKIPPKAKPTTEIIAKRVTTPASENLRKKKQIKSATINGIINSPLLRNFLNKYPMATEPNIAAISYAIGIWAEYSLRSSFDLKYRGSYIKVKIPKA